MWTAGAVVQSTGAGAKDSLAEDGAALYDAMVGTLTVEKVKPAIAAAGSFFANPATELLW